MTPNEILENLTITLRTDGGQRFNSVQGFLFKPSGKFGYDVKLDYSGIWHRISSCRERELLQGLGVSLEYLDPNEAAEQALRTATKRGTSEVSISDLGNHWTLVVPDPPNGFPIMVRPESHWMAIRDLTT